MIPADNKLIDPTTHYDDKEVMDEESFFITDLENIGILEKRVTDICDLIANNIYEDSTH